MSTNSLTLEVCIESVESALAAEAGGANRVELCDNLMEGGTTPSLGMVELALEKCNLPVMMMIRPRGGDFLYTDIEFDIMKRNVIAAKKLGVYGVVFGLLTKDGQIDKARTAELIELARPLKVTIHRAFDMTIDPHQALEDIIELGAERVLTSGQEAQSHAGIPLLKKLVEQANGRIIVMPGGGVKEESIQDIVGQTGVRECHVTGKHQIPSEMKYFNPRVFMGVPGAEEYEKTVVNPDRIRQIRVLGEKGL